MNKNILKLFAILMLCFALVSVLVACGADGKDGADGKSPYMGEDGKLYVWDADKNDFVGYEIKGEDGDDGKDLTCGNSVHVWGDPVVVTEHTYDGEKATLGVTLYPCTVCGVAKAKVVDHVYTDVVTAPTCVDAGFTTHTCACGHSYKDTPVDATGHKAAVEFDPEHLSTCEGCDMCAVWTLVPIDEKLVEGVDYCPCKYEHNYSAPCINEGCSETIIDYANATGHHWGEEKESVNLENKPDCQWDHPWFHECTACTCAETEEFDCGRVEYTRKEGAKPHDFTNVEGVVTTAPTCTTKGVKSYACTYCGKYEKTEDIPALGHDYTGVEGDVTTAPTCTTEGVKSFKCNNCHEYTKTETIDALGHDKETHDAVEATCTGNGWDAYETCKREGCTYTTRGEDIPALGHSYTVESEVVLAKPDELNPGSLKFICDVCKKAVEESNVVLPTLTDENCGEEGFYTKGHEGTHCGDWVDTYTFTVTVGEETYTNTIKNDNFSDHTEYVEGVTSTRTVEGDNYIYTVYKCEKCGLWVVVNTEPKPATETPAV